MKRTCLFLMGSCLGFLLVARPTLAGTYANIAIDDAYADWASIPGADYGSGRRCECS